MRTGKFKVYTDTGFKAGKQYWWFTLSAPNSKIICVSETYNSKQSCLKGISPVIHNAATATIEEIK